MVMISSLPFALLVIENNGNVTITWHNLRLKITGYFVDILKKQRTRHSRPRRPKKVGILHQPRFHVRALYAIFLTCAFHGSGRKFGVDPYQEMFVL